MSSDSPITENTASDITSWPKGHLLEAAWGIIANVDDGNGLGASGVEYSHQTAEWREAAERWRDAYMEHLREQCTAVTS